MGETRRDFVILGCWVVSLSALGSLAGCSSGPTSPSGSGAALPTVDAAVVNGVVMLIVDSSSPLSAVGTAALVRTASAQLLVAHTGNDTYVALTAICTHEGCTVTEFQNQFYTCPCHGSRFTTSGAVANGPANQPLRRFPTQLSGTTLTVALV
jgi:cytochrome b6-f complex iron-sulfur subunit